MMIEYFNNQNVLDKLDDEKHRKNTKSRCDEKS